jgi:hypothetical protein
MNADDTAAKRQIQINVDVKGLFLEEKRIM